MAYFRVVISGEGIDYAAPGERQPHIGFFTTRDVRARDLRHAQSVATALVRREWEWPGGYATCNRGDSPRLTVEYAAPIGWIKGLFGRKPRGYSFYTQEDARDVAPR